MPAKQVSGISADTSSINLETFNKFDYIGNSHQDLKVWEYSENIIYTNVSKSLLSKINVMNKNKICIKSIFN